MCRFRLVHIIFLIFYVIQNLNVLVTSQTLPLSLVNQTASKLISNEELYGVFIPQYSTYMNISTLHYEVRITNSLARISMIKRYENKFSSAVSLIYKFR